MKNENRNEEAVSPVIATILMVAITVVLAGVLYVWASSLAEGNANGEVNFYSITAADAQGSPTTGTEDTLLRVTMEKGGDINWAAISVKISVNNEPPLTCDNNNQSTGPCWLDEFGTDTTDNEWSVGDGFTITEKSNICDGTSECKIEITITNTQLEENIDKSSAVAA